ncbi:hypothetical protein [Psychroflexus torquis]|uniref:hypothetical protein n=1 Tax=Psychroflexus torquis TaxID=57029 RepID=UPI0000D54E08|nr:hypothetical protein [Psychroflexus torquis]
MINNYLYYFFVNSLLGFDCILCHVFEGARIIPFEVRNGPEIAVVGLKENEIIESNTVITINAYGSETSESFIIRGSKTQKAVPSWVWACIIAFVGFAIFYFITHWTMDTYKSFF